MKIAVATDEGNVPARHFGRAAEYKVFTIQDGRVAAIETRAKPVCDHGPGGHHDEETGEGPDLHTRMSNVIADCQVVLARGIPGPMQEHLSWVGLRPVQVRAATAEEAVEAYLAQQG